MKRAISKGGGGGTRGTTERSPRRYACATDGCEASGTASEMVNIGCDPATITRDELLRLVRCASCAACLQNGAAMRTFPLNRTLNAMRKHRYAERGTSAVDDERGYLRWISNGKKTRVIRGYAERYGALPYYGDPRKAAEEGLALPSQNIDEDGGHRCGLPISCCDKRQPAYRYLTVLGEVVGICRKASAIFFDVRNAHPSEADYRKLLSTDDKDQAEKFARRWLRGGR